MDAQVGWGRVRRFVGGIIRRVASIASISHGALFLANVVGYYRLVSNRGAGEFPGFVKHRPGRASVQEA